MAVDASVVVAIEARSEAYRAELAKLPGFTEEQAAKAAAGMRKGLFIVAAKDAADLRGKMEREAEKAAAAQIKAAKDAADKAAAAQKAAAAAVEKSWNQGAGAIKGALSQVGGTAGQLGGILFEVGEKATGAGAGIGVIGAAAAGGIVAVGAIAVAAKSLADNAVEAAHRLEDMGLASMIPEESQSAIRRYEIASGDLRTELDLLTVTLGAGVATHMSRVAYATIGAIDAVKELSIAATPTGERMQTLADTIFEYAAFLNPAEIGIRAVSAALDNLADRGGAAADATRDVTIATIGAELAYGNFNDALEKASAENAKRQALADRAAAKAKAAVAEASAKAAKAERDEAEAAAASNKEREATARIEAGHKQDRADAANAGIAAIGVARERVEWEAKVTAATTAGAAAQAAMNAKLDEYRGSWAQVIGVAAEAVSSPAFGAATAAMGSIMDLSKQQHDREVAQLQERMEKRQEEIDAWLAGENDRIDSMVRAGQISEGEAQTERKRAIQGAREKERAANRATKAQEAELLKNFKAQKSWAIGAIVVDAAAAGIRAFAELGPVAGGIAAIAIAADAALALDTVRAEPPPEFPTGLGPMSASGSPDHQRVVALRDDEGAFNGRATAALGGPDAVQRLNETGQVGTQLIVIKLDGREIAAGVVDRVGNALMQPTPGSWSAGKRPLYGGR